MTEVSRNDLYMKDEKGPEWFDDFLRSLADNANEASVDQEIMSAINNKRGETVESVVRDYREQVGLDIVQSSDDDEGSSVKQASIKTKPFKPLSIRHAEQKSIVDDIKQRDGLVNALESMCKHSGGTVKMPALINFLRKEIGNNVSFADEGLKEYLTELKEKFMEAKTPEESSYVGLVGLTDDDNYDDDAADYATYDGAKQ